MRPIPALSLTLLALACSGDPLPLPTAADLKPSLVTVASPETPNVIRFSDQFAFGIQDPGENLIVFAGLPPNPDELADCGGVLPYQFADIQFVGVLQRAIKSLIQNKGANIHLFRLSEFHGCGSVPIARGTGQFTYNDSDIFYTGGQNDSWGYRIEGNVTYTSGGTAHLLAHNRWQIQPDGTLRLIFRDIKLQ